MASAPSPQDRRSSLGRRAFLKQAAILGAGLAAGMARGAAAAEEKLEHRNEQAGRVYRRFGRTNLAVSALAFGGVPLTAERMPVFQAAVDRGVNFIMAHPGKCTDALAPWLKVPANRGRLFLGSSGGTRNLDEQLKNLGVDCIDVLMPALNGADEVPKEELPKEFEAARKAGKARFLCLVFHANVPAVWRSGLKTTWFDAFLPTYSAASRGDLKPLITQTREKDIGLMAMKTLKGMPKDADPVATWKTFLEDGFDVILKGMTDSGQLDTYLRLATQGDKTAAAPPRPDCTGECSLCGLCSGCPRGLAIQDALRTWQYYGQQLGWMDTAREQYARIPPAALATACGDCGRCELLCPRHLPVRRLMREAHAALA